MSFINPYSHLPDSLIVHYYITTLLHYYITTLLMVKSIAPPAHMQSIRAPATSPPRLQRPFYFVNLRLTVTDSLFVHYSTTVCVCVCVCVCAHNTNTRTHACTHTRTHTRTHARTHARTHTHTHTHTHPNAARHWPAFATAEIAVEYVMRLGVMLLLFISSITCVGLRR